VHLSAKPRFERGSRFGRAAKEIVMDRLNVMQVFTKVVDLNSFSRAAEALDLPNASVSTAIQALESHLKVRLLNRTTRRISLTPDGAAYYERCIRILADVEAAENSLITSGNTPTGKLRVDMSGSLGRSIVVPALPDFQARYPGIELMLGFGDKDVDLVGEGVDCVVRIGELPDSSLVACRLGSLEMVTVASPSYLRQHGTPSTIRDLDKHIAINYLSSRTRNFISMHFVVEGKRTEVRMRSSLATNEADAYVGCATMGLGIIQIPLFLVHSRLAQGDLVEILPDSRPAPLPISAVYPHHRHLSPQVRTFVEWIAERFEQSPLFYRHDAAPAPRISTADRGLGQDCRARTGPREAFAATHPEHAQEQRRVSARSQPASTFS
jgi:LysR family transcriptional regulator for bpeEF and oprC